MGCSVRRQVTAWANSGCHAELSPELLMHVRSCPSCWQFVTEVNTIRKWAQRIPVYHPSPTRLESIQTLLRTEARRPRASAVISRKRRPWQWLAVAAIGLLAGTAGIAAVKVGSGGQPTSKSGDVGAVIVGLSHGARGRATSQLLNSPYELLEGEGEFDVGKLGGGQMFRVHAGRHVVLAQQAHFRLRVSDANLSRIEVVEGHVFLLEGDVEVAALAAGQVLSPKAIATPPPSAPPSRVSVSPRETRGGAVVEGRKVLGAAPDDAAFARAYRTLGAGRADQAASMFDTLLTSGKLDASRRADVLYWASQAHARAGNAALAEARARAYVDGFPDSLHGGDAALLLGDYARGRGDKSLAQSYYERAARAPKPATRARAREALAHLMDG